jgi:predicted DNA-binding antitoxin AbrB/MazE fold protein
MKALRAIYEHGVFRPLEPVDLPEATEVFLTTETSAPLPAVDRAKMARVHEVLSLRFDSGEGDIASRHNEHQP